GPTRSTIRSAGTIVKDEGEGGKQLAEFLAGQKFI
ncbi:electron transfer flavoprotein subunit beta, partial [Streptomyces violascens]